METWQSGQNRPISTGRIGDPVHEVLAVLLGMEEFGPCLEPMSRTSWTRFTDSESPSDLPRSRFLISASRKGGNQLVMLLRRSGFERGLDTSLHGLLKGPVSRPHLGLFPVMDVLSCVGLRHFISHLSLQLLLPCYAVEESRARMDRPKNTRRESLGQLPMKDRDATMSLHSRSDRVQ